MLESYCEKQGWEVVVVYQDDGYTGLNMERPDLKRMLKAIERRQINLVITKDLSRLGRNYLQTGTLIEDFFPRHGVRYIATVSYTHLDVYKRQISNNAGSHFIFVQLFELRHNIISLHAPFSSIFNISVTDFSSKSEYPAFC